MRAYANPTICPNCQQVPGHYQFDAKSRCGCGRTWPRVYGKMGDVEEHDKLTKAQFQTATDNLGNVYYIDSFSNLVWLYEDGTWRSEPGTQYRDLDSYLEHITAAAA